MECNIKIPLLFQLRKYLPKVPNTREISGLLRLNYTLHFRLPRYLRAGKGRAGLVRDQASLAWSPRDESSQEAIDPHYRPLTQSMHKSPRIGAANRHSPQFQQDHSKHFIGCIIINSYHFLGYFKDPLSTAKNKPKSL